MSSDSMVSKPLHFFDVPEINDLRAEFTYNFFVSDETVNEDGNQAIDGNLSSRFLRKGTVDTANLNARIPRYVTLNFSLEDTKKSILSTRSSAVRSSRDEIERALQNNLIYTEEKATAAGFSSLCFDNSQLPQNLENFMRLWLNSAGGEEATPLEILKLLSENSEVDSDLLESMLPPSLNDEGKNSTKGKDYLQNESKQFLLSQLNSSYAPFMMRKSVVRGTSLNARSVVSRYLLALGSKKDDDSDVVSNDEYTFEIPYIDLRRTADTNFVAQAEVVGFVIEKKRVYNGVRYPMPPIIATGNKAKDIYDSEVAYGQTYEYTGRTIAKFRIPATDADEGVTYIKTFLVASKPSPTATLTLAENRIPEPPRDVNFHYEYDQQALVITWAAPVNPQRDVKYIQVFKRKSTSVPFELIANLDFDDSMVRTIPKEFIDPDLTTSFRSMPMYLEDTNFNKDEESIYALVAVDARQLSSNYSTQIKVGWDYQKNKIKKEFISFAGSPKQYPNWNLKQNFFPDSVKDSSHMNLKIYFNPEAYTLIRNGNEKIPAFCTTSPRPSIEICISIHQYRQTIGAKTRSDYRRFSLERRKEAPENYFGKRSG